MAAVVDKRGLSIPLPGNLVAERSRVIRHVKINESGRMSRLIPQRQEVLSSGVHPQRWWRVNYTDGSYQWFVVNGRVVTAGSGPGV